jgi:hypothetical protein
MHQRKEPIMQTSHFTALRRRLLPLAALAAAAGLGGCIATAPAPAYYGYNAPAYGYNAPAYGYSSPAYAYSSPAPAPYYNNGSTATYTNGAVYPATYPLYSPYFHGAPTVQSGNGG